MLGRELVTHIPGLYKQGRDEGRSASSRKVI